MSTSTLTLHGVNDVDWQGFLIVMGILILATAAGFTDWFRNSADKGARLVDQALVVDHATCIYEGCDVVLCYCRDTVAPCKGTAAPGCGHVELVCDDHRLEHCGGCRADARFDAGHAS